MLHSNGDDAADEDDQRKKASRGLMLRCSLSKYCLMPPRHRQMRLDQSVDTFNATAALCQGGGLEEAESAAAAAASARGVPGELAALLTQAASVCGGRGKKSLCQRNSPGNHRAQSGFIEAAHA